MRGKSEKNEQEANSDIGKIAVGDVRTSVCQIKVYDQGKRKSVADSLYPVSVETTPY